ncbi:MAG: hypothetical protein ACREGJ_02930 [Candidatus Saccharimonadales bacterium]
MSSTTGRVGGSKLALFIAGLLVLLLFGTLVAIRYDWFTSPTAKATNMPIGVNVDVTGNKVPKVLYEEYRQVDGRVFDD